MTDIVERLRFRADENYEMLANIHEPLLEAADEIERLRAALEFYGNPDNWKSGGWVHISPGPVYSDKGDKARAALGGDE
jgi:hypothetical protein